MKKLFIVLLILSLSQSIFGWTKIKDGDYRGTEGEFKAFDDGVKSCIRYNKKAIKELEESKKDATPEEEVVIDFLIEFLQQQTLDFTNFIDWTDD